MGQKHSVITIEVSIRVYKIANFKDNTEMLVAFLKKFYIKRKVKGVNYHLCNSIQKVEARNGKERIAKE